MSRHSRSFTRRLAKVACGGAAFGLMYNHWVGLSWHAQLPPPVAAAQTDAPSGWTRKVMWARVAASSAPCTSHSADATIYDVCVIGGGLTGLYTAVDAAQRGLKVVLVEAQDFGGSQSSSLLGFLPGAFPHSQRAWRQRDATFLSDGIEALADIRTWSNVAPGCVQPVHTLIPGTNAAEGWELRIAAWTSSLLSLLTGSWNFGHRLSQREVASVVPEGVLGAESFAQALGCGVRVQDAVLDVPRVVSGLALTARQLGAHTLNYAAAVDIASEEEHEVGTDGTAHTRHSVYRVSVEDRSCTSTATPITVAARTIVNCTGSAIDSVRQYDTWLNTTMSVAAAKSAAEMREKAPDPTGDIGAPPQLLESCLSYEFFVVPRDGLVFQQRATTEDHGCPRPVFYRGTADASSGAVPTPPLEAFVSSSTLRAFSSITVLPFGADGLLVGGAAPVRHPPPALSHFSKRNHTKSHEVRDEEYGVLSLAQRRAILRSVEALAEPMGMTIPGVASCRPVQYPLLGNPSVIGNDLATRVEYQGFGVLVGGTGGQGSMVHLLGGNAGNCRRAAAAATDAVATFLATREDPQRSSSPKALPVTITPSKTQFLRLAPQGGDADSMLSNPASAVRDMVCEGYAVTIEDVIARRTQAAWLDPGRTRQALPHIASLMACELGWSKDTTAVMIANANAFLDRIVI